MRKQIWRMTAAVVGTIVLVSAAAAQVPATPAPIPPAVVAPGHPHAAPTHVAPAPIHLAPVPAVGGGCGPVAGGTHNGKWADKYLIGQGTANPVGCGCLASERTFFWGGCKQFFTPGKTCDGSPMLYNNCGGHGTCNGLLGGRRANCPPPAYAWPYGQPANSCCGPFSYLDR